MMTELQLFFLGPGRVVQTQRGEIQFRGRLLLALLAYLAVESGQAHSRESLLGLLWPERSEADARNNLRVTWSRLRKMLETGGDVPFLSGTRFHLQFNPDSSYWLDVAEFEALLAATRRHPHPERRTCPDCCQKLAQAAALYQGDFLTGFYLDGCPAFEEWQYVQRERLHLRMLEVLAELTHFYERSRQPQTAEQYARHQVQLDPLRESAHRQLMRALAAQGQRSTALSQFQTCETTLQAELGVEPNPETILLRQAIESGDFTSAETETVSATSPALRHHALPRSATPFIGRETELEQLNHRFTERSYRLISLVGPGGIGKTRLALQAARAQLGAFRDGVCFVPLDGVQSATEIPAAIAEALNVPFSGGTASPQAEILRILQDQQLLLVIDNLEHVIDEGADLLLDILQNAPDVVLLVTSRERINVQAEDLFRLRGLSYPDSDTDPEATHYAAVRLFADRAYRLNKDFTLSPESLRHVVQICRLVEGLPLGLELAATWVRDVSVKEIAVSLAEDFDLLATDLRDVSPRHRNAAAVFEHSWRLMTAAEQSVLSQLAVFRGGVSRAAAQRVADAAPLTLTRLRYKSLLRGSNEGRYSMHELLRQLALRKLNENPTLAEQSKTQHSHYFLTLLQTETDHLKGERAAQTGAVLRLEIDNIRQAWRWAVETAALDRLRQSAAGLVTFFVHEGLGFEAAQLLRLATDSPGVQSGGQPGLLPYLLTKQLSALESISTLDEISPLIERILALTRHNPTLAQLEAETYLIWSFSVLDKFSDPVQARIYLDRAFAAVAEVDDPELEARLLCESGRNYLYDGQFDRAVTVLRKALRIFEDLEHLPGQALAYSRLAPAYAEAYRLGPALFCDREALRLYQQIDNRTRLGVAHHNLSETYVLLGAYEPAKEHSLISLEIGRQQASKIDEVSAICQQAIIMDRLGEIDEAEKLYRMAIPAQKELKINFGLRYSLLEWGDFQLRTGRLAEAEITFDEAIATNSDTLHLRLTSQAKQAQVYLAQGKISAALTLANAVWPAIEPIGGQGLPFPLNTMYECYAIFEACGDGRAGVVLQLAADVLKRTAAEINDPEMRASFLNNVPVSRQLQAALSEDLAETDRRSLSSDLSPLSNWLQ